MYQLGAKWKIWDLRSFTQDEVGTINLRGYNPASPIILPADYYTSSLDGEDNLRRLSVASIASGPCPNKRDLFLEKKVGIKVADGHKTWGRLAGHLIEDYLKGLPYFFRKLAQKPKRLSYQRIQSLAEEYSSYYWESKNKRLSDLLKEASTAEEDPERLVFMLQQTVKYELALLGMDYALAKKWNKRFTPLTKEILIEYQDDDVRIKPAVILGISDTTTPDFTILHPEVVMGEIKTGSRLEPYHLHTVAGYALAYESQYKVNVDFGIVYFIETHVRQMSFPQSYMFVIDNFLRRKFLDARNKAYSVLQLEAPPDLADYEKNCKDCKFLTECYPNGNV